MEIRTLEDRKAAAAKLLRVKALEMSHPELDLAAALLLHKVIRYAEGSAGRIEVLQAEAWVPFSPQENADDFLQIMSTVPLVTSTHECQEDADDPDKVTGHWHGCHGFYSGVKAETYRGLRETVGVTCALLLAHSVKYGVSWGND